MQIRFLAGFKRLAVAFAIASLVIAPTIGAATPTAKGKPGGDSLSHGGGQPTEDSRYQDPVMYPRQNYHWPFAKGPIYGTVDASRWTGPGVLHTAVGTFDLTRGMPELPAELKTPNRLTSQSSQYFLLQVRPEAFTNGAFDQMKAAITQNGGSIVGEIPVAAFIVKMNQRTMGALRSSGEIIALEPYPAAFKIAPEIGRVPLPVAAKAASSVYSLTLRLFPGEASALVGNDLTAMGAKVISASGDMMRIEADSSKLGQIASLDAVMSINEDLPIYQWSEEFTTTVQTGRWNNGLSPYVSAGIDGGGLNKGSQSDDQILMVLDNGFQLDAADLSNTRTDAGLDVNGLPIAGHRKVAFLGTTAPFGGSGDLLGCDGATTSGVTHGHAVAVVALGQATNVPVSYGAGWSAVDGGGNSWSLDGVAPYARLVAYDAQITPLTGSCSDPTQGNLDVGDLYTSPSSGSLADGYTRGARIVNFSWGSAANQYDTNAAKIDSFLFDHSDSMIFIAAGNTGRDLNGDRIPDPLTIGAPATAKNGITVGCSQTSDDLGDPDLPNARWSRSSNGPATQASGRIAPLLMAPGQDAGSTGLASQFNCRSNDNNQTNPVECDVITGVSGVVATSYASATAAGAGLLVRDYFAQGFYPDGTNSNPGNAADQVSTISGDLLKALLVASADWMNQPGTQTSQLPTNDPWSPSVPDFYAFVGNLTRKFRGNREQGFGRIQLSNVLPLQSYPGAVTGLIVDDGGGLPAGLVHSTTLNTKVNPSGTSKTCSLAPAQACEVDADCTGVGTCVPYSFNVCDTSQPLTVVIAWTDPSSASEVLSRHLLLQLTSPSGRVYYGNFFTDDTNDNAAIDAGEDCTFSAGCPWPGNSPANTLDTGPWSLPFTNNLAAGGCTSTCSNLNSHMDINDPVQAVFLSPDSKLNGIYNDPATSVDESADNQIEQGVWSVVVSDPAAIVGSPNSGAQNFSIAIAGGVCQGSSARVQKVLSNNQLGGSTLTCNDSAVLTIDEIGTTADPIGNLTNTEIASRTKAEVLDGNGNVIDTETFTASDFPLANITQNGNNIRFDSRKILLTDGTAPDSGNGVLDVRDGYTVRVTYQDESPTNTPDPNGKRTGSATVNCKPALSSGGVVFGQFGKDTFTLVSGGCEKDARGYFTFGFPDRYMDQGELVSYTVAFQSAEIGTKLTNVSISLRAVTADADSPANCKPGTAPSGACTDPNRTNNVTSPYLTVLDTPKVYGSLPAGKTFSPTFTIQMSNSISGTQKVDMLIGVTSASAGKSVQALIAKREILNADAVSLFYSTDFPTGGTEPVGGYDVNNNEQLELVTVDPALFPTVPGTQFNSDYVFETRTYSDMTATGTNTLAGLQAPWNFDSCSTGGKGGVCGDGPNGFVSGLNNTSRPPAGVYAQWGEDKNFNGRLDGFCTGDLTVPCTQGIPVSQNCKRCSLNKGHECNNDSDCTGPPNDGTCVALGSCNYSAPGGEDRDPVDGNLSLGWSTAGGCGWQTKSGNPTGGIWHTGLIKDTSSSTCVDVGSNPSRCQSYEVLPDGDSAGDNEWWELLLTPVLNKVNQQVDGSGDPVYQVQIMNWAWNMLMDFPDGNTQLREEFDTDINKVQGVDLFNDQAFYNGFAGPQGAISNGNAPITGGFNMFAEISHCLDTDGNGSPDHCGTAAGALCGGTPTNIDAECTGADITAVRGHCSVPPAQKVCTGAPNTTCTTDANCAAVGAVGTERCVTNYKPCTRTCSITTSRLCTVNTDCPGGETCQDSGCGAGEGTCTLNTDNNREGKNNCYFEGKLGTGLAKAQEYYGLATPKDDDQMNGYCNRSDSLNGVDRSKPCVVNSGVSTSYDSCTALGSPYTTCNFSGRTATAIDQYVQANGPGRNFDIRAVNGQDMEFNTLEDLYGDTGNQFRAALEMFTRERTTAVPTVAGGFGIAVDDMVVSWKETRLDEDSHTHCSSGGVCADIETSTGVSFDGATFVNVTVTDATPYDAVNPKNDCNGDGDYTDATKHCWKFSTNSGDNTDCTALAIGASCDGISSVKGQTCFAPDSNNCNMNFWDPPTNSIPKRDVAVLLKADSPGEETGELAYLDETTQGGSVFKASFPYSTFYDSQGTLFVVQSGTAAPLIRALYTDRNDGTGSKCKNVLDPTKQGLLEADTRVTINTGRITVNAYKVNLVSTCTSNGALCTKNTDCPGGSASTECLRCSVLTTKPCDPDVTSGAQFCSHTPSEQGYCTSTAGKGDADGFADSNETIQLAVQFANKSGVDVDDLTATLGTNSPNIECISRSTILVGSLAAGALSNTANYPAFQFKVANINRANVSDTLQATFTITMRSNKFDALTRVTTLTLDLDLNATGTAAVSAFFESFESNGAGGFGQFFKLSNLDQNKHTEALSNGYRCQYNDPFGLNSNSIGESDCFLGFTTDSTSANLNDWHIHTSATGTSGAGMGRAFTGVKSAHWGVHNVASSPTGDTYRFKQLDAFETVNPIYLPLVTANPELNFAQQVSFIDNTSGVNVTAGESPDRGVVEVQVASNGVPQGPWIKIYPYQNVYDQQGTDDFSNCTFDPIDDGNNEDSFFNPTDPQRFYGPSSTCFPEFNFVRQGQTDYRKTFDVNDIGAASDGPGLQGCSGAGCLPANTPAQIFNPGTWVRPRFQLAGFAGREIRLRFLSTTIELGQTQLASNFFGRNDVVGDDGWYIDDIHIDQALGAKLTLSVDTANISANAIPCGTCSGLTAALTATPTSLSGPGQVVTLDAKTSSVTSCLNGIIQYQFWIDSNNDSVIGNAGDTLLRDFTDNPGYVDAPTASTPYGVIVRCSTNPSCPSAVNANNARVVVNVTCPSTATLSMDTVRVNKSGGNPVLSWASGKKLFVDIIRSSTPNFAVPTCLANDLFDTTYTDAGAGSAAYYLLRTPGACNVTGSGAWGCGPNVATCNAAINAAGGTCSAP